MLAQAAGFALLAALSPTALLVTATYLGSARLVSSPAPLTAVVVGLLLFTPALTFIAALVFVFAGLSSWVTAVVIAIVLLIVLGLIELIGRPSAQPQVAAQPGG